MTEEIRVDKISKQITAADITAKLKYIILLFGIIG